MPIYKDHSFRLGASGASAEAPVYEIDQSIRFNQAENASMSRTPSSASSRTTWTFSWWWKRGNLSGSTNGTNQRQPIFGTTAFSILSNHNSTQIDGINVVYTGSANDIQTSEKYRDVSAWYHFVFVLDTTNEVSSERVRLYKNGERVTSFASITYPSKDTQYTVNNTQAHYIGLRNSGENLDGYLAEMHFVDGYAYGPEFFGTTNSSGIWIPIDYDTTTGNYGTNGFKIDGSDSATLGKNVATGNTYASYTSTGLAAHDKVLDTPNNIFAVFNSLVVKNAVNGGASLSEGNLRVTAGSGGSDSRHYPGTVANHIGISPGKYYFEFYIKNKSSATGDNTNYLGVFRTDGSAMGPVYDYKGNVYTGSWQGNGTLTAWSNDDIIGVAMDVSGSESKAQFYLNGSAEGSEYTATGQDDKGLGLTGGVRAQHSGDIIVNFGQDSTFAGNTTAGGNSDSKGIGNFKYSVPTGYLALCTRNLFTG